MKYHIEKGTVQETLIIPLYARKKCTEIFPELYRDETAAKLVDSIDYDFSAVEKRQTKQCIVSVFWKWQCAKTTLLAK